MIKRIKYTVQGVVDCEGCSCVDVYICLGSESTVTTASGRTTVDAIIEDCHLSYKVRGQYTEQDPCTGDRPVSVVSPETELTLKYESSDLSDPEDEIALSDISCVTTDACAVRAAVDLTAREADPGWSASNFVVTKSFDPTTDSSTDLANYVATLVQTLIDGKTPGV